MRVHLTVHGVIILAELEHAIDNDFEVCYPHTSYLPFGTVSAVENSAIEPRIVQPTRSFNIDEFMFHFAKQTMKWNAQSNEISISIFQIQSLFFDGNDWNWKLGPYRMRTSSQHSWLMRRVQLHIYKFRIELFFPLFLFNLSLSVFLTTASINIIHL